MVENTSLTSADESTKVTRRNREAVVEESVDLIECSGEYCSSCTATIVADCIAVCCCPCAIANLVILTFVKVPYMMGRRCLGLMKKKGRLLGNKKRKEKKKKKRDDVIIVERNGNLMRNEQGVVKELLQVDIVSSEKSSEKENFCARYEAERVWLEMYELGHLGFGRVSFSGVPDKGN
ncbi:hypothetical protein IFM89_025642 [Coptis chinensis]|uniref:Uncharacterized protein n=1 Tax=Coptis chinensis TaxID=261450 RepID=A0A835LX69_9MAGN|nr:hypothetical protein IFM89_025642 [Coptis chinensis]